MSPTLKETGRWAPGLAAALALGMALWGCGGTGPPQHVLTPSDSLEKRSLEIGFGVGYLVRTSQVVAGLERIATDGFRYVRVYEPFTRRDDEEYSLIVGSLELIVDRGLTPYFSLSNFPHDLAPERAGQAVARYSAEQRERIQRYSNRYPPVDLERYREALSLLLNRLDSEFGRAELRRWYYEIGNEPDAARFFWGYPEDFERVLSTAVDALRAFDGGLVIGAAAFTSGLMAEPEARPGYAQLARTVAESPRTEFFSFHVYDNHLPEDRDPKAAIMDFSSDAGRKIISEWNVSSRSDRKVQSVLNSPRFMNHLLTLVAACYEAEIELVLVHKLMDYPDASEPQLGLLDREARPKKGYEYILEMLPLLRDGFTVRDTPDLTIVQGSGRAAVLAKRTKKNLDFSGYRVLDSSFTVQGELRSLSADSWVLLEKIGE